MIKSIIGYSQGMQKFFQANERFLAKLQKFAKKSCRKNRPSILQICTFRPILLSP
ncbi:hypothetical protein [Candidatus Tisiphia endosymbiont of Oplodontha viridula]|uniref:hypothetical protein n=1 Tax=Candidatus Tisiphia endosymbiont of Oplodontha viridula TaxID=3077925 RepID=UPI0035C9093A